MNIAYLITRLKKGPGPINQALNLATAMKKLGVNFYIVCISPEIPNHSWEQRFVDADVSVVHLNRSMYDFVGIRQALKKIIREFHIDVIHSSGLRPDLCNVMLGSMVPHVTTQRCEPCNIGEVEHGLVKWGMEKVQCFSLKHFDKVIACSESLAHILNEDYQIPCGCVQNGVNVDTFHSVDESTCMTYRKELGLPTDKILYVYMGSFWPRKDISTLLEAFKQEKDHRVLVVVGGTAELVDRYRQKYPSANIIFTGRKDFPVKYLQCGNFGISASLSEGLPNTILESLACGLPVVLSDIGPHEEMLNEGDIGVDFHVKDVNSLRLALDCIEAMNYNILRQNCLDVVEHHFSKYVTAKKYIQVYNEILTKK